MLTNTSNKSTRVGPSTSKAKTLSCVKAKEIIQLINVRLAEVLMCGIELPLYASRTTEQLIRIQEQGLFPVPIDHVTDCGDLFELATGL